MTAPSHPVGSALTTSDVLTFASASGAHIEYEHNNLHTGGKKLLRVTFAPGHWDAFTAALAAPVAPEPAAWLAGDTVYAAHVAALPPSALADLLADPCGNWTPLYAHPASQPAEAVSEAATLLGKYKKLCIEIARGDSYHLARIDAAILALAGTQAAAETDTETMVAEVAAALEVVRARHIVEEVQALNIGGKSADMPTPFHAGYQLACEEILTRLGGAHASDCALHNGPAYPPAPCDCSIASSEAAAEPVEVVRAILSRFERCISTLASEDYGHGYREACSHVIRALPTGRSLGEYDDIPTSGAADVEPAAQSEGEGQGTTNRERRLNKAFGRLAAQPLAPQAEPGKVTDEEVVRRLNINLVDVTDADRARVAATMAAEPGSLGGAVEPAAQSEKGRNTPIEQLMAQYTEEMCDFTNLEWVRKSALRFVRTMPDSQSRCLLYALAAQPPAPQATKCALCGDKARIPPTCDACHDSMGTRPKPPAPQAEPAKASDAKDAKDAALEQIVKAAITTTEFHRSTTLPRIVQIARAALSTPSTEGAK